MTSRTCPTCGAPLTGAALRGNCPRCLLGLAATPAPERIAGEKRRKGERAPDGGTSLSPAPFRPFTPASPPTPSGEPLRYFGDYELQRELARGGMGVVYQARQVSLNRLVALKMIAAGQLATPSLVQRFRLEAEAAARLNHPNIVPIYEVGEHQGQYFYSMELVKGGTLSERIANRNLRISNRQAATLVSRIAEAVHYAHQHGVLHRDLKPTNILLDAAGEPHVTDFGLAKLLENDSSLTQSAATLGTPAYMAPEQAAGDAKHTTTAADVYGLGVVLYEMLAGQPPFAGVTVMETLQKVIHEEPTPPSRKASALSASVGNLKAKTTPPPDRDLETICLKCLSKEPAARYGSAEALAQDLDRWLAGEPILARPVGAAERLWRWCRRRPGSAALVGSLLLLALIVTAGSMAAAVRIARAHHAEQRERERAIAASHQLERANRQLAESVTRLELQHVEDLFGAGGSADALASLAAILRRDPSNSIAAERLASALTHRSLALPVCALVGHLQRVTAAAFSPDGRMILSASWDGTARIWDSRTGQPLTGPFQHDGKVMAARFSPDARFIATASEDGTARIWESAAGRAHTPPLRHDGPVKTIAFSPDGSRVVTASFDRTARVWDAHSGALIHPLRAHTTPVLVAEFSPDGQRVVTGSLSGSVRIWDVSSGQLRCRVEGHKERICSARFSPDGKSLLTAAQDGTARLWNAQTGEALTKLLSHGKAINCAQFSPDGQMFVTASQDGTARLWTSSNAQPSGVPMRHEGGVLFVTFSRDGRKLATTSLDNTARVWDVTTGEALCQPLAQPEQIVSADFSPDGQRLVTASYDWTAQLWDVQPRQLLSLHLQHTNKVYFADFSPDGNQVITAGADHTAGLWDSRNGQLLTTPLRHERAVFSARFSTDGHRAATTSADGSTRVWDSSGRLIGGPFRQPGPIWSAHFSPDGRYLLTAGADRGAHLWEIATGNEPIAPLRHEGAILSAIFSRHGERIVTASADGTARVWDARSGRPVTPSLPHLDQVKYAEFSPDANRVVTASVDNHACVWDAHSGARLTPALQHTRTVGKALFSPDGQWVATVSLDRTARLWDARTGLAATEPMQHDAEVSDVQFSPDGKRIITACADGAARLWDARTGQPLTEPLRSIGGLMSARFSPDGQRVVTASAAGVVAIWDVPRAALPVPEWFPELAESVAHLRYTAQGHVEVVRSVDISHWVERMQSVPSSDSYGRLCRWFLANPAQRPASPFGAGLPVKSPAP